MRGSRRQLATHTNQTIILHNLETETAYNFNWTRTFAGSIIIKHGFALINFVVFFFSFQIFVVVVVSIS